jgi:hypothetical protein
MSFNLNTKINNLQRQVNNLTPVIPSVTLIQNWQYIAPTSFAPPTGTNVFVDQPSSPTWTTPTLIIGQKYSINFSLDLISCNSAVPNFGALNDGRNNIGVSMLVPETNNDIFGTNNKVAVYFSPWTALDFTPDTINVKYVCRVRSSFTFIASATTISGSFFVPPLPTYAGYNITGSIWIMSG